MDKIKNFILRYKVTITIVLLLVISFTVYFLASAENDPDENKFTVANTTINITDGTANVDGKFDANDEPGNDSSDNNSIVRNFDSITYDISYELATKPDQSVETSSRKVDIDVLVPTSLLTTVNFGNSSSPEAVTPQEVTVDSNKYYYYNAQAEANVVGQNTMSVTLTNINSTNGTVIKPIIRLRESTDNDVQKIGANNDSSTISNLVNKEITVTSVPKLSAKLYPGTKIANEDNTSTIPVGILLYIPNDPNKGIKGVEVPTETTYTLDVTGNERTITFKEAGATSKDYPIANLPDSYKDSNATISKISDEASSPYTLKFTNIKYNNSTTNLDENTTVQYISSNIFVVNSNKGTSKNDSNINFKLNSGDTTVSTTYVLDNYVKFIGEYNTKINFRKNNSTNTEENFDSGLANYNIGEDFKIVDTINYGSISGDDLNDGLTNYIKIDNGVIQLLDGTKTKSSIKDEDATVTIEYGVGEWDKANFTNASNAPKYCKNVSNLTKEELMNYYGGPCITEKENAITWYDDYASIKDSDIYKIILVKYTYDGIYKTGETTDIILNARIKNSSETIGKTAQVVSRGTTTFNNNIYYLSPTPRISVTEQATDLLYSKTTYDIAGNVIKNNIPENSYGNTIFATPFRVSTNIVIKDKYGALKENIYSGSTDPMSISISPILQSSNLNQKFSKVNVEIYLPVEMEVSEENGDSKLTLVSSNPITIGDSKYYHYTYEYTEKELSNLIKNLPLDNIKLHAYIGLDVEKRAQATVITTIDAMSTLDEKEYNSYAGENVRTTTKQINLINNNSINVIGKLNTPTYFDKNTEMVYNMRAVNVSGKDTNLSLIKVIPYNGDYLGDGTKFDGNISVSLASELPQGYKIYYTKNDSKTIINNELSSSSANKWEEWKNPKTSISGITAIKIVSQSNIPNKGYFAGENGINLKMKTSGNKEGNTYYNNFYILRTGTMDCASDDENCNPEKVVTSPIVSNTTYSSVYNRSISGYVFEDYDVNGFYSVDEKRISDIAVSLYKVKSSDGKINLSNDTMVAESITDKDGYYSFKGLASGNYYVKYVYDCDKYTLTTQNKIDTALGDTSEIDSDASAIEGTCGAVSRVVTLDNKNVQQSYIDMGLRLKQNFGVNIKKYITNVVVNSNRGTQSYDYNNETKVKIDVKNMKNTTFRVTYSFEIENSKYFPGTIGSIIETIPEGMTFDSSLPENDGWYESDGQLYYTKLDSTLILPEQKYYIKVVLDLKTDDGGTYVNLVSVQDLKPMEYNTGDDTEGVEIKDDEDNTIDFDDEDFDDEEFDEEFNDEEFDDG